MKLIDRSNYFDVLAYLEYQEKVLQRNPKTVKRKWGHLRHLLNWGEDVQFPKVNKKNNSFPAYLVTARNDGKTISLSPESMDRACREVRDFFQWAKVHKSSKYNTIPGSWIDTIRPSKSNSPQSQIKELEYYSLDEVLKLCSLEPERLIDKRDRAAVALCFVAGLRVSALVSLPVKCVEIENLEVHQLPSEGVITKNSKAQITFMLPVSELLDIIHDWVNFIKAELGEDGLYYPNLSTDGTQWLLNEIESSSESRRNSFSRSLRRFCQLAGIEYRSPHKLRHGHGVYVAKMSKTYEEFKAYSQNMGHETTEITERYYSSFARKDVKRIVTREGKKRKEIISEMDEETLKEFREFQAYKKWRKEYDNVNEFL